MKNSLISKIKIDSKAILLKVWKEKRLLFISLFLSIAAASLEGIGIGLIIPFLQGLLEPLAKPLVTGNTWLDQYLLDINGTQTSRLFHISFVILFTTWLRSGFAYLAQLAAIRLMEKVLHRIRCKVFEQLESVSLSFYAQTRNSDIFNLLFNEVQRLRFIFSTFNFLITRCLLLITYLVATFLISWQLTVIAILLFGLLSIVLSTLLTKIRSLSEGVTQANKNFSSTATEFINGIRTVKAFSSEQFERSRYYSASQGIADANVKNDGRSAIIYPLAESLATTILVAIICFSVDFIIGSKTFSASSLLTLLFAMLRILPIVQQLNGIRGQLASFSGSIKTVSEFLNNADKPYLINGRLKLEKFCKEISFQNVSFSFTQGKTVLRDINLKIKHGQTVAIVGSSGSGKSTLADLILRFYDPTSGQVLIDGIDLQQLDTQSLRAKIAVVSQETFIFNDSIAANIGYNKPGVNIEMIREAAEKANALDFILESPQGFESNLGDRGTKLSGGQRQRIAIARALLRDPEILILDEATSALDSISESLVQSSLETLMENRTVIMIAHRLSTIQKADWIVVLEEGRIVEQGSYQELLSRKGKLWNYHNLQFGLV